MNREEAYKLFWSYEEDVIGTSVLMEREYQFCVDKIYNALEQYKLELSKAYADNLLEMKSRTCESCKYQEVEQHDVEYFHTWCLIHCTSKINEEMEDFYCSKWEKK